MTAQNNGLPDPEWMNNTELIEILRKPGFTGERISYSVPRDRLVTLVRTGATPEVYERSKTLESRKILEAWVSRNSGVISQLPCGGPDRGKCTIYPCSDGRHASCWLRTKGHRL